MKKNYLIVFLAFICLSSIAAGATHAQQEEHQDDGSSDCIATWDPFCPRGTPTEGGGGGGDTSYCDTCEWIPEGPDGEPARFVCAPNTAGCCEGALAGCEALANGCAHDGYCSWA